MERNDQKRRPRIVSGILRLGLLWSLTGLMACASAGATYTGRLANPASIVTLRPGDLHELKWQTEDLRIDATYALDGTQLNLAGRVQLQDRLAHYPTVAFLRISVHAIDGNGVILASYPLWSAPSNTELFFVNWAFDRKFSVPADTRSLTFSYSGRMQEGGGGWGPIRGQDDGGISWDFWRTP
jgi:hypothetical protein